jgi:hypothetical protein
MATTDAVGSFKAPPVGRQKPRLLIFIVAYFAERTIAKVVRRIPNSLLNTYDAEILIIDDSSVLGVDVYPRVAGLREQPLVGPESRADVENGIDRFHPISA